jgi:hypothetical protein
MSSIRSAVLALALLLFSHPLSAQPIEAGLAVTDSDALQELEARGLALSALFSTGWRLGAPSRVMNNAELAAVAPLADLREVVRQEFRDYEKSYLDRFPEVDTFGVGIEPNHRKFERNFLDSKAARFELVGVVNRMDRTFRTPETCGEVRFLYRLAYGMKLTGVEERDGDLKRNTTEVWTQSRLPMTINLVLKARTEPTPGKPAAVTCQELASRWLDVGKSALAGRELARALIAANGALALVDPSQIDRMETNIQVVRVPATIVKSFGGNAEYLLHIFKWDPLARKLTLTTLENQVDRIDLLRSPEKLAALKAWLFTPERLQELAEGTIKIPDEFLAKRAITSAPGGTARATNRPFLGLVSNEEAERAFSDLKEAAARLDPEGKLRNIDSPAGLQQRLTDITCTGCHQSRAIGGFHFLGADKKTTIRELPQNSIFIAGSPHFYSDLPRRRAVVEAIAAGKAPDFGRGFSMRPRVTGRGGKVVYPARFNSMRNGWGANCYVSPRDASKADASFKDWQCAGGLKCKPLHHSDNEPGMGICLTSAERRADLRIGDPFLFGELTAEIVFENKTAKTGPFRYRDRYCAKFDILNDKAAAPGQCLPIPGDKEKSPGDIDAAYQGGGFFGGMHKVRGCTQRPANTVCGSEAGDRFSRCVSLLGDGKRSFNPCLTHPLAARAATLRACNVEQPCRDDYVCLATKDTPQTGLGACLPPYFLFQFRIDGHPTPPEGPAEDLLRPN